jgi:hypothetical protein
MVIASPELHFLVFSFNRGDFLLNCVRSIRSCAPFAGITVWDDHSTDAHTQRILEQLSASVDIRTPSASNNTGVHGALYDNMQIACHALAPDTLICTIQDDMQLVRPIAPDELQGWHQLIGSSLHSGFVHPVFLKNLKDPIRNAEALQGFYVDRWQRSAGAWYSDIFMIKKSMLDAVNWTFSYSESENEQQARQHFGQMLYLKNPFIAWLPAVPAWRGKRRTWAVRHAEKVRKCGFYPFRIMSVEEALQFRKRPAERLPWAEEYLSLEHDKLAKPWFYQPLQRRPLLRQLHKAELVLRKYYERRRALRHSVAFPLL